MTADTVPARRLREALEPIAALSFHSEPALDAYAGIGLDDFFSAYFWSRSSVLGPVDASVVTATFGVWAPGFVAKNLKIGRAATSLDGIRRVTDAGARTALQAVVPDEPVSEVVTALRRGIDAADPAGRPLFAGNRAWPWPADDHLALWRAATAWRELRGDSHLAACVIGGITGLQANILNELDAGFELGEYTRTRDWSGDDIAAGADALRSRGLIGDHDLTDDGRELREQVEQWTDAAMSTAVDAVGEDLDRVVERCEHWSQLIVDRGWFPDDQRKRDAG